MEDAVEMPITLKLWLRVLTPVPRLYRNTPFNLKELRCITKNKRKECKLFSSDLLWYEHSQAILKLDIDDSLNAGLEKLFF